MINIVPYKKFGGVGRPEKESVTFDFDGVLHTSVRPGTIHPVGAPSSWAPSIVMMDRLREEARKHDVYIVSARDGSTRLGSPEIWDFVRRHGLPVKGVVCTSDDPKLPYLEALNSIRHYDDNPEMEGELDGSGIEFVYVDPSGSRVNESAGNRFEITLSNPSFFVPDNTVSAFVSALRRMDPGVEYDPRMNGRVRNGRMAYVRSGLSLQQARSAIRGFESRYDGLSIQINQKA